MNREIAQLLQQLELLQQVGQALNQALITVQHGLAMADMQIDQLKRTLVEQEAWVSRN
jgi:hypothetical protein